MKANTNKRRNEFMTSKIISTTLYSPSLRLDWNYDLYFPIGYEPNQNHHGLLMLHGLYGNHTNFLDQTRINSKKMLDMQSLPKMKQYLIIFIDGFNSFYLDSPYQFLMEHALMFDLLPFLKTKYHLISLDIAGISMGGYGAARLALRFPKTFQKAGLISPAVWQIEDIPKNIKQSLHVFADSRNNWSDEVYQNVFPIQYLNTKNKKINFFIESSKLDTTVPINDVRNFANQLKNNGNPVSFREDNFGQHCWPYWQKAINNVYKWILA